MALTHDNGQPPVPEGMSGAGAGGPAQQKGIVLRDRQDKTAGQGIPMLFACILCMVGGFAAGFFSPLACLLVGFGALAAGAGKNVGVRVLVAAGTLVFAGIGGAVFGIEAVPDAMVACVLSLALAELARRGKLTPTVAIVAGFLATAAHIGIAEAFAAADQTTLASSFAGLLDGNKELLAAAGIDDGTWQTLKWAMGLLWPAVFGTSTVFELLCSCAGAGLAAGRLQDRKVKKPDFGLFDLPLWVVAIFVAAVAGMAAWVTQPALRSDALLAISGNALLVVRYALAAQGFAVLEGHMRRNNTPAFAFVLAALAAAYLEVQFIVMSIVGLVDVWANFRHLTRGEENGTRDTAGATKQD